MAFTVNDKTLTSKLNRQLEKAKEQHADAVSRLASGSRFSGSENIPTERAISETMESRIRSLSSAKRNISDAISLLQTGESGMAEINNHISRMKEINLAATNTTLSNQERRYLFIEYEGLFDEINRIAITTEFNGIPLLNGKSEKAPEELVFRVDDPYIAGGVFSNEDVNTIRFSNFKAIGATAESLGLKSVKSILEDRNDIEGISLDDIEDIIEAEDSNIFPTAYDQAISLLSGQRAIFGSLQSRLHSTLSYLDVYQENIEAAKSVITDTDYVQETANMLQAKMFINASTALLAQSNINTQQSFQLLNSI